MTGPRGLKGEAEREGLFQKRSLTEQDPLEAKKQKPTQSRARPRFSAPPCRFAFLFLFVFASSRPSSLFRPFFPSWWGFPALGGLVPALARRVRARFIRFIHLVFPFVCYPALLPRHGNRCPTATLWLYLFPPPTHSCWLFPADGFVSLSLALLLSSSSFTACLCTLFPCPLLLNHSLPLSKTTTTTTSYHALSLYFRFP